MILKLSDNYICDNSLECEKNCYFVLTKSNEKFLADAKAKGAQIITPAKAYELAQIPKDLKIIGITGTNGKTTTATLISYILNRLNQKCLNLGTRGAFLSNKNNIEQLAPKGLTTNQFLATLSLLKTASQRGCEYCVMEVSSHAIAQKRIQSLPFILKIFTNLSQDHLDFHKTFDEYARTKSDFFADDVMKLINADDANIKYFKANSKLYSCQKEANFFVINSDLSKGIKAEISANNKIYHLSSQLQGRFNLYNILCAFGACVMLGFDGEKIIKAIADFDGVAGRMQIISSKPLVIVDFAHTPDGILKVLESLQGRDIIAVFGAGGDRDALKRPIMGEIAARYAKTLIITSDNPRSEEPNSIIAQIRAGIDPNTKAQVFCEVDRKKAIKMALDFAKNDEIIVILGKGDEDYQEINGIKYHFSDSECVRELLAQMNA